MDQQLCRFCNSPVSSNFFFCPTCGKKLHEPPITIAKQISVYAISILFPPLGLWPGIRYVMQKDEKTRTVGIIAIILTIVSTIITIWLFMNTLSSITSGIGMPLNQYQNLGY
jgi:hypothetical protein